MGPDVGHVPKLAERACITVSPTFDKGARERVVAVITRTRVLQRKLKKPYREGDRFANPAADLYASAGRNHYMPNYDPSEQDEDHDNIVPFTPEKDIYTNSIRPYQPPQGIADPVSSPRRKKLSLKASKNRRKLDFFADEEEEDEEEQGDDAFDYYG